MGPCCKVLLTLGMAHPNAQGVHKHGLRPALEMLMPALHTLPQVCPMGSLNGLTVKERREREEQAKEVAMKSAVVELKVQLAVRRRYRLHDDACWLDTAIDTAQAQCCSRGHAGFGATTAKRASAALCHGPGCVDTRLPWPWLC